MRILQVIKPSSYSCQTDVKTQHIKKKHNNKKIHYFLNGSYNDVARNIHAGFEPKAAVCQSRTLSAPPHTSLFGTNTM